MPSKLNIESDGKATEGDNISCVVVSSTFDIKRVSNANACVCERHTALQESIFNRRRVLSKVFEGGFSMGWDALEQACAVRWVVVKLSVRKCCNSSRAGRGTSTSCSFLQHCNCRTSF